MTQEKMRKVITACVSAATVLFVLLLGFLVYQWIYKAVLDKRIDALTEENKKLEEQLEEANDDLSYYESVFGKEWLAFQNGFVRPEEN
ncbi:MAG: hypothetical protein IKD47_02590 [Clostridia bacterium]|nr:hypothetical protein [Clostridia bacterium]